MEPSSEKGYANPPARLFHFQERQDRTIEAILERIAIALEQLVDQQDNPKYSRTATDRVKHQLAGDSSGQATKSHDAATGSTTNPKDCGLVDSACPADTCPQTTQIPPAALQSFLESKNIAIKYLPALDAASHAVMDSLSNRLGTEYQALRGILARFKVSMNSGNPANVNLKGYSPLQISTICDFCSRLFDVALLSEYRYLRSPERRVVARVSIDPSAQQFFTGRWLERFVVNNIKDVVSVHGLG